MSLIQKHNKTTEIERRWLLKRVPVEATTENILNIQQWYDETDRGVIRYRCWHNVIEKDAPVFYEKIIKMNVSKGVNTEEHFPITFDEFKKALNPGMKFIEKTRYVKHDSKPFRA